MDPSMNFLNSNPHFKLYKEHNCESELFYIGVFDRSIASIFHTLDSGKIPYGLKGNFAFFFKNKKRVVFAVDHACTYNMHWNSNSVSHIFNSLRSDSEELNPLVVRQRQIFYGTTVGKATVVKNIQRLEPGMFFEKDLETGKETIDYYIDLFNPKIDPKMTMNDLSDIFETVIEEQTRTPFSLLWSSGTDSNCVYGFIRKLKRTDQCTLLSLYSNVAASDERPQIEELEKVYNIKTNFYNLGLYQGITDELKSIISDPETDPQFKNNYYRIWKGAMWEPSIFSKYKAMYDLDIIDKPMLTGEPGDLIFGNSHTKNILNTITQRPHTTVRELAEIFVCGDMWLQRRKAWKYEESFNKFCQSNSLNSKSWDVAVDWIVDHFPDLKNSEDIINSLDAMYYQYKAPKLIYGYSQFEDVEFRHPFLDYRIYSAMLSIPGIWKMKNWKIRQISREIIKDHVDPRPWTEWPKSGIELLFVPRSRDVEEK
jgi:asparagine synthetase B (glutamine-hydrolysing)